MTKPHPNVNLVRDVFHAWNTVGDLPSDDVIAPDFELHSGLAERHGHPYVGPEGVRQWIADVNELFGGFGFELEDVEEAPGGRVLAIGRIEVEGKGPAPGLERPAGWVIEVRDGLLARMQLFADQDEARIVAAGAH